MRSTSRPFAAAAAPLVVMCLAVSATVVPMAVLGSAAAVTAASDPTLPAGETAEDAAAAITRARQRANDAVDAWAAAHSKLDALQDEKDALDREIAGLHEQIANLEEAVSTVAVNRYLGVTKTGIDLLAGNLGPTEQAQTAVLVGVVNDVSAEVMDRYDALGAQLADKQSDLADTERLLEEALDEFHEREQEAEAEVARLKQIEQDRLQVEAVQQALEAQRRKELEEQQRQIADQLARDQEAAIAAQEGGGSDGGDEGAGVVTGNEVSLGSSGGTTGNGGSGNRGNDISAIIYGQGDDWVCPVQGVTAFGDTWGYPRSGGRLHQGVDMISDTGTPIVAVVDGTAIAKQNTLGGTTISFLGVDGNRYYYAHLSGYGQLGNVVKGTVIGYVGQTGNARESVPHLHFEIHPGGGAAVNPYPTIAANC